MNDDRPTIRAFELSDSDAIAAVFRCPSCQRETLQMPYRSIDELREKFANPPANLERLVAEVDGRAVGILSFHVGQRRRKHSAELGMFVHDDYQGRGIGSALLEAAIEYAENWLDIRRMELKVYIDNARAIALYEKHGFEREGQLRGYSLRDGEYVDVYAMARVRA